MAVFIAEKAVRWLRKVTVLGTVPLRKLLSEWYN